MLDEFDKLFKGATDTFMAPDLSDVYLLTQMLRSGEIVPLYNGFEFFGGLYCMQDDNLYKLSKSGITGSVAPSAHELLIDGFNGFYDLPMGLSSTLLGGNDEGLNRLIWCYQLDFFSAGSNPCVISAEKRFQHPYLLMFDYKPASFLYFFAIPHGNNLYLTCTNTEVFSSAAQVGAFYKGKQNLINLLLLVHAKSQDPPPHGNWKNIVHPKKFKKQFENKVISPLSAMFSDGCLQTVSELAAMDIDTDY